MGKLFRFCCVALAASLALTGTVAGGIGLAGGLLSSAAAATPMRLLPLGTTLAEPSTIYADDGTTVLGVLSASENRKPVSLSQVSAVAVEAVLDTEDERFFQHGGVDLPSTLRALASDTSSSGGLQGGSTITQQLVKQTYVGSERTLARKVREAVLADRLQVRYSRDQILQAYLNTIYLGNGAYGLEAAAGEYFGVHASDLTLPEAALFAGMIQDPNGYDPIAHPVESRARRSQVLARMVHYHTITPAQRAQADASPLPTAVTRTSSSTDTGVGYYARQVVDLMLGPKSPLGTTYQERYHALYDGGLRIYTNLDPREQSLAESAVATQIDAVGAPYGDTGALAAVEPATGKVRALVGGPGFSTATSAFDLATQAYRQPGSGFKLFTLLAAYESGYGPNDLIDGTAPCPVGFPGDNDYVTTPPVNAADGEGAGAMSIDAATTLSVNCAFIRLAQHVGLPKVLAQARNLGVVADTPSGSFLPYPSVVIGGQGATVLQMADAYATVADDGVYHAPSFVDRVVDHGGATIYSGQAPGVRVVPVQVDRMVLGDLENVVLVGTGTAASLYNRQAAGKTGTTDSSTDAWFNGITPQLAATVWMGNPTGDSAQYGMLDLPIGQVFGGTYPAFAWQAFMQPALSVFAPATFPQADPSQIPLGRFIASPGTGGISGSVGPAGGSGSGGGSGGTGTSGGGTGGSGGGTGGPGGGTGGSGGGTGGPGGGTGGP
ncbi:MAG: transglycosylase domain-containing protein, partial [Acidimicrobiales bacterium]